LRDRLQVLLFGGSAGARSGARAAAAGPAAAAAGSAGAGSAAVVGTGWCRSSTVSIPTRSFPRCHGSQLQRSSASRCHLARRRRCGRRSAPPVHQRRFAGCERAL